MNNLARSWLLRCHIRPQPLIQPQQVTGSLPPTVENWPDAAGAPPEKSGKTR